MRTLLAASIGKVIASEILTDPSCFLDTHALIAQSYQFSKPRPLLLTVSILPYNSRVSNNLNLDQSAFFGKRVDLHCSPQRQQHRPFPSQYHPTDSMKERRPNYLHTRAHRIRWPDPLSPNRIYLAELLDVDDVDPAAHDLVEAGVGGLEAGLNVAHCLMLRQASVPRHMRSDLLFSWVRKKKA
jgi:hypothetical protein